MAKATKDPEDSAPAADTKAASELEQSAAVPAQSPTPAGQGIVQDFDHHAQAALSNRDFGSHLLFHELVMTGHRFKSAVAAVLRQLPRDHAEVQRLLALLEKL